MKSIGVVIVSYCGKEDTIECIESIINTNRYGIDLHIVVVDNASPINRVTLDDLSNEFNKKRYNFKIQINTSYIKIDSDNNISITLISSKENCGFGSGNNIGIKYLKYSNIDYIVLINNDTIVPNDFFINILKFYSKCDSLTAISPKSINYYNHDIIDSEGFGYFDINTGRSSHCTHYKIKYLVGSCIIANDVNSLPLFDEAIFLYSEDVDYSLRLLDQGFKIFYDNSNFFYHKVSASTSKNNKMELIKLSSLKYIVGKHGRLINKILFYFNRTIYYSLYGKYEFIRELWKNSRSKKTL